MTVSDGCCHSLMKAKKKERAIERWREREGKKSWDVTGMWRFLRRRGYFNHSNREKPFLNLPFNCSPEPLWGSSPKRQSFPPLLRELHLLWGTKKDPAETRRQNTEAWGFSPSFLRRIMWDQLFRSSSCSHTLGSGRLPLSPSSPAGLPLACSARGLFEKAVGAIKWNRPAINSLSETRLLSPFISIRVFFFVFFSLLAECELSAFAALDVEGILSKYLFPGHLWPAKNFPFSK